MRRLIALIVVLGLTLGLTASAAYAGDTATDVALGLAAFAVFNQVVGPLLHQTPDYAAPVYVYHLPPPPPQVIYVPQPQVVVVEPPTYIVVVPETRVYYARPGYWKKPGPPPWAGYWKKHKKWDDD